MWDSRQGQELVEVVGVFMNIRGFTILAVSCVSISLGSSAKALDWQTCGADLKQAERHSVLSNTNLSLLWMKLIEENDGRRTEELDLIQKEQDAWRSQSEKLLKLYEAACKRL